MKTVLYHTIILSYLYLTLFAILAASARLPSIDHLLFRFWAFVGSRRKLRKLYPIGIGILFTELQAVSLGCASSCSTRRPNQQSRVLGVFTLVGLDEYRLRTRDDWAGWSNAWISTLSRALSVLCTEYSQPYVHFYGVHKVIPRIWLSVSNM